MKKTIIILLAAMISLPSSFAFASELQEASVLTDTKPSKKSKKEVKEVTFSVHLHCANCVKKVQENIAFEKGVKDLKVSLEDQTVAIKYDPAKTSDATLKAAIEKLGYKVGGTVDPNRTECAEDCDGHHEGHHHDHK